MALTAWSPAGLMGDVLRLGARGAPTSAPRPARWGRYETATLHFSRFEAFEMVEATLELDAGDDDFWALMAQPPGPLAGALARGADAAALRAELDALAAPYRHGPEAMTLSLAHAVITAHRPGA